MTQKNINITYTEYKSVEELIPESQTNENKDWMALFTLIGFSLMMVLDVALG